MPIWLNESHQMNTSFHVNLQVGTSVLISISFIAAKRYTLITFGFYALTVHGWSFGTVINHDKTVYQIVPL